MKVAVLGSGGDALAVAADMSCHGRATTLADFDDSRADLAPVAVRGAITIVDDEKGESTYLVTVADDIVSALDGAELIVVATVAPAHDRAAAAVAPHVTADQTLLFLSPAGTAGSGAITARRAIDPPTVIAEANAMPCLAGPTGPTGSTARVAAHGPTGPTGPTGSTGSTARVAAHGPVAVVRPRGGVLIATLPATPADTARVMDLISDVWPCATATDSVWNMALANFNAVEKAIAMTAGVDTDAGRTGDMLWGEGATPAVTEMIETVDSELLALRRALNSKETLRYQDFLAAQGLPSDLGPGSSPSTPAGTRRDSDDVPYALVLASSLGAATGVPTPAIDQLVDSASDILGRDLRAGGPTLATLGLNGLDTTGLIGFARAGWFP